jgi:hypothetical protein
MIVDRLQQSVAGSPINDGVELCLEMDGMTADPKREFRYVGGTVDFDPAQFTVIFAFGRENPSDPAENREIRISKRVGAGYGSSVWLLGVPGTELPLRLDQTGRFGIGELGRERHRPVHGHGSQSESFDLELVRLFARLLRQDLQKGAVRYHFLQ